MAVNDKNLILKVLVATALFLIFFFGADLIATILGLWYVKIIVAALLTYAVIGIADKIGLPGFSSNPAAKGKKK
jgi:uncharacterized membrane protein YuzA (DUF378 family)